MTANEFVIEVGNKISGRAIPVRTPNMLKAAEVLSPASLSFKGIKIASILVKRFKTTRFPVKGTDKRPIFGRAFLKSQSRNLEKRTAAAEKERRGNLPTDNSPYRNGRCHGNLFLHLDAVDDIDTGNTHDLFDKL